MTNQEPVINLNGYSIHKISYKKHDSFEDLENLTLEDGSVSVGISLNEDESKSEVKIKTEILDKENNRSIIVEIAGYFDINIKEEPEKYLAVNGSAMLYPYLRSVVSIISSLDSENQILLPTINTSSFAGGLQPEFENE